MEMLNLNIKSITSGTLRVICYIVLFTSVSGEYTMEYEDLADPENPENIDNDHMRISMPMFQSYKQLLERLQYESEDDPEGLYSINLTFHKTCGFTPNFDAPAGRRKPFIVIEGNYKKTSVQLGLKIADKLGGVHVKMPPRCLKPYWNKLEKSDKRKYFTGMCLYAISHNIKRILNMGIPVVAYGYWSDVTAHIIERTYKSLPPPYSSSIYSTPEDLIAPDMLFYVRTVGILHNNINKATNGRIRKIYQSFRNPQVTEVELFRSVTSTFVLEVLNDIVNELNRTRDMTRNRSSRITEHLL